MHYSPKAMSQNLSPFHSEILAFLEREAAQRALALGYDEAADPALKSFKDSVSGARLLEEGVLPIEEIAANYRYLFDERGPLHLEKKLIAALSSKEAKERSLRIYRGLPRLYRRDKPSDSRLKPYFAHLPALKRLAAEKAVFPLYGNREISIAGKATLFSWVIPDGWGDYATAARAAEILRQRFPDLQLGWVVLFPKRLGSPPVPQGVKTHIIPYDKECPLSAIKREALEILRTSDLVLQVPSYYPHFEELRKTVDAIPFSAALPPVWTSLGEYGFIESQWFHPQSGNRSFGLHFLEKGVLVQPPASPASFSELSNFELLQWMFGSATPGPAEIEEYEKGRRFYLAYLSTPIGGAIYLHALAKAMERDPKHIDLCCPDVGWLIRFLEMQTQAGKPVIEFEGVSLELYHQGKAVPLTKPAPKKIRIFSPPSISPGDFNKLMQLSGEWAAVRGNQSFSEAVSASKAFFFDGRDHVRYFLKDLLALAENRISQHRSALSALRGMWKAFLHNLPLGQGEWVEETDFQEREPWKDIAFKIGIAWQDPDCLAGFKKLNRIIAEEHSANEFLGHLVQRTFAHREEPELARVEEAALRPFLEGRASLPQAIEDFKNRIGYVGK